MITKQQRARLEELMGEKAVAISQLDFDSAYKTHAAFAYVRASDSLDAYLEELTTATEDDGWIPWSGGACPVPPETLVDIKSHTGMYLSIKAGNIVCSHEVGSNTNITAYRIAK